MEGEVGPEEGAPILVTLKASVHASFYSIDLICKVRMHYRETHRAETQLPINGTEKDSEVCKPLEKGRSQSLEGLKVSYS
jgi:hypothetical protein